MVVPLVKATLARDARPFKCGSMVRISVAFHDAEGNLAYPSAAVATLLYRSADGYQSSALNLTQNCGNWIGFWDSRFALPGKVLGYAKTVDDLPIATLAFEFSLLEA